MFRQVNVHCRKVLENKTLSITCTVKKLSKGWILIHVAHCTTLQIFANEASNYFVVDTETV